MAAHAHITPRIGPKAFPGLSMHEARLALEAEIEKLISYLDRIDGDSDFEPDADREPSLGWPESHRCIDWFNPLFDMRGGAEDLEEEDEHAGEADVGEVLS